MTETSRLIAELNVRSQEVFRRVVEGYLDTGEPVGSRTLTRSMSEKVSAATVRNVMQDLEYLGLLDSPHISAGRLPTELGLRLFVDGILEMGSLAEADREKIDASAGDSSDVTGLLDAMGATLSRVTQGASLVMAPKHEAPIRHIDFVNLAPDRALVVLVFGDGHVENRVFTPPAGYTPSALLEAANFLNAIAEGHTLSELSDVVRSEIGRRRQELDTRARDLVETGLAVWENQGESSERLIVRGRANLLGDGPESEELERVRELFDDLERKRDIADFLTLAEEGEGVRIFIGSENKLFSLSGSSLVVSPYMNADRKIVGAVGVIGPTRLNYGRVVPVVEYTAQLVGRLIGDRG